MVSEVGVTQGPVSLEEYLATGSAFTPEQTKGFGKRRNRRARKDNKALRVALTLAASRPKGTFLSTLFQPWVHRMRKKEVIAALAHRILVLILIHYVLSTGEPHHALGTTYHDTRDQGSIVRRSVKRLHTMRYRETLEKKAPPSSATG